MRCRREKENKKNSVKRKISSAYFLKLSVNLEIVLRCILKLSNCFTVFDILWQYLYLLLGNEAGKLENVQACPSR